ncbi:MAG: undecaprenyldiphospho-muramoylpentapeptide beta-N-acetylglucosaminyltransferase [Oceanicaulis sp.]|uniref:undecaprenyldiphospho-muramoylpentapeptide beta-N-acetylglucosaminyltransferase n=1 Tax=Glycocaulis sp. TaxID=1969725 RepID=UPI0025C0B956|nr:undecaprenyldiphospho-muramoylpentapeptide beta-N-acetylglucosaminyltransferase [Glycocaulis sp.]MCC5981254.1 undecaprenyldiphospho-muramoylpentapeptide beta-N-acetylglucosaminyltransferase [Oceanicaulis sp.]MCH8522310.1 undecaprenyldiphospho-muramoylpentapeptide beta-N-acetylglucosaminyltransferase [Glycocaulis sp.]
MSRPRLLIAAGGTGGHIFPARAVAETLVQAGWQIRLVTDARGLRHAHGFPGEGVDRIEAATPLVKNPVRAAANVMTVMQGFGGAGRIISDFRPDVIAGFGGYPAFPALAHARLKSIPYLIHEQNAVLGRVNRLFAKKAFAVASGFDRLDRLPRSARHEVTGNPVRAAVLAGGIQAYEPPAADGPVRLLVIGGSLGARILSDGVPRAVAALPEALRNRLEVTQQARAEQIEAARTLYADAGVKAHCEPFFEDMGPLYRQAHLVISRSGASSVSEIAALGRPALLVPLEIAMDDHQRANAEGLVAAGAAQIVTEAEIAANALPARLESLLGDGEVLASMAGAALQAGKPDAHLRLASLLQSALG